MLRLGWALKALQSCQLSPSSSVLPVHPIPLNPLLSCFHTSSLLSGIERYDSCTQQEVEEMRKPTYRYGVWLKPKLSARMFKKVKVKALEEGRWELEENPDDPPSRWWFQKPGGGGKWARLKVKKLRTIEENMKKMPKLIEQYKKNRTKKKQKAAVKSGMALMYPGKYRKKTGGRFTAH
uniref:MRPL25 domain-containing protein n=1 Tax=Paramoeba aestuarina TaxID=180227 RepID=A0A7S4N5E8_9EUKA|mmetsp:Transcript_11448/g.17317  ORF Transcript_11448/g.17317 Transcript_11448/m.17317 type:complete len:179 (+) Transcript_11448:48-584(+)